MKAIRIHAYGGPEQLIYEDVANPVPGAEEVVVAVAAVGVNPADYKFRNGMLAAAVRGLPFVPGMDIAGRVESVGEAVSGLCVGDRVMAMLYLMGNGAYAERVAVPAAWCASVPAGLDDRLAAALPTPATTAIEWIEDDLQVTAGNRVLVTGATGAVGRIACYIAKSRGAHVIAGVRRAQIASVLYADEIILLDERETPSVASVDCIADAVGGETAQRLLPSLKPGGVLSTVATDPVANPQGLDVEIRFFGNDPDAARLAALARDVAEGRLQIDQPKIMSLSEAPKAHELLERGGWGKIVLVPDGPV